MNLGLVGDLTLPSTITPVCVPGSIDDPRNPIWGDPSPYDYEFDQPDSLLPPPGWSIQNPNGSVTYREAHGVGRYFKPTGALNYAPINRPLPGGTGWTVYCKWSGVNLVGAANGQVYPLFLTTSSGSSSWNFGFGQNYDGNIVGLQWSNSQTYSSSNYNSANPSSVALRSGGYARFRFNSTTSWDIAFSVDGLSWPYPVLTAFNPGVTFSHIGFCADAAGGGYDATLSMHWWRVRYGPYVI